MRPSTPSISCVRPCPVVPDPGLVMVGVNMVQARGPQLVWGMGPAFDSRRRRFAGLEFEGGCHRLLDLAFAGFGGVALKRRERDDSLGTKPLLSCWPSRFSDDRGAVKVSLGLAGRKKIACMETSPRANGSAGKSRNPQQPRFILSRLWWPSRFSRCPPTGPTFGPAAQCARSRPSLVFWHSSLPESHAREFFVGFLPTLATILLLALRKPNPRPDTALLTPEAGLPSPFLDALDCEP